VPGAFKRRKGRARVVTQEVDLLLCKHEALSSNPSSNKQKNKDKGKGKRQ
jgi:hypothetical protein